MSNIISLKNTEYEIYDQKAQFWNIQFQIFFSIVLIKKHTL